MSIQILKKLEEEINRISTEDETYIKLGDVFDLIVGTSTGGLIALGLGKCRMSKKKTMEKMTCTEIDTFYEKVAKDVFNKKSGFFAEFHKKKDAFWEVSSTLTGMDNALDTDALEKVIKDHFSKDLKMIEETEEWKAEPYINVITTLTNNCQLPVPVLIRNYEVSQEKQGYVEFYDKRSGYRIQGICDCKVFEAARATSAAPIYFKQMVINMPDQLKAVQIARNIQMLYDNEDGSADDNENKLSQKVISEITAKLQKSWKAHPGKPSWWSLSDERDDDVNEMMAVLENAEMEKTINRKQFMRKVYDFSYTLTFVDGGLNSNSPCLFAYTEARELWPDKKVVMFSVGTGRPYIKHVYESKPHSIYLKQVFDATFSGKEIATLRPMFSLASNDDFDLQRINPQIDGDRTSMAAWWEMAYWRTEGTKAADKAKNAIENWATFLYEQRQFRDEMHSICA